MSRIDISIIQKETEKTLINKGFCRSPHVTFFCEQSQDPKLQDFAYSLDLGVTLSQENVADFLQQLEYVVQFLTTMEEAKRSSYFSSYNESSYEQFIEDLTNGRDMIQSFLKNKDFNHLEIEIV